MNLTWSPEARIQWKNILDFFNKRNKSPDYSIKLDRSLNRILTLLCDYPEWGQETSRKSIRRHCFENYAVFYRVVNETLEVTAIVDARQDRKPD